MTLVSTHCQSLELCDTCEIDSINAADVCGMHLRRQTFAECTEGDMHAAGFAVNGSSIDGAVDISDSVSTWT